MNCFIEIVRKTPILKCKTAASLLYGGTIVLILIVSAIASCGRQKQNPASPVEEESALGWLSTAGNRIVNQQGQTVILHGVNRSGLEYDRLRGNGISEAEIDYICQQWHARVVRIPFNEEWALSDETYRQKLDEVIRWIKGNGAYTILDLQWQDTVVKIPSIPDSNAIGMWQMLARRYRDEPSVLYDIHNEAHDIDFASWRRRAMQIIEAIRAVHPQALILVSGMNWAADLRPWAGNPLPYNNVVYSVHIYPWVGGRDVWENRFGQFADKLPIYCGELGGEDGDVEWGKELIRYLQEKQIGWCAWSWVDRPYLTSPEDRRTPTAFGQLVKTYLTRYAMLDSTRNRIYDLQIASVTSTGATITWRTDWKSDSRVLYGTTINYTDSLIALAPLEFHTVKLSGLHANTTYYFRAVSVDEFGLRAESGDSTFQTLSQTGNASSRTQLDRDRITKNR